MNMHKKIAALTLSAALVASGAAFAQQAESQTSAAPAPKYHRVSAEDRAALLDARIAALKAGLKLNADQDKLWPDLEKALRDQASERAKRMDKFREELKEAREEAREGRKKPDYLELLRKRAVIAEASAGEMRKLADAVEPLYKTLDDAQKRRLSTLLRMISLDKPGYQKGGHGKHKGDYRR